MLRHLELLVERSGLLADLEHLLGGAGEQLGLDQAAGRSRAPSSICWRAIVEPLAVDDVAAPPRSWSSSPSGSGTPALTIAAQDAAEALEDRVLDDALDDRDLEDQPSLPELLPCRVLNRNTRIAKNSEDRTTP